MFLSRFCGHEAKLSYQNLKIDNQDNDKDDDDIFLQVTYFTNNLESLSSTVVLLLPDGN